MASICPPPFPSGRTDPNPHWHNFANSKFSTYKLNKRWSPATFNSPTLNRVSDLSRCCRCHKNNNGNSESGSENKSESDWWWDIDIQETFRSAIKKFDEYLNSWGRRWESFGVAEVKNGVEEENEEWDWERWRKHFAEVDEQERIVSVLKSQLARAIDREDYGDAARLKVAIAAAATNDTVGRVMSHLKKAVQEERYSDAALVRDYAGTGLVGWWAGISEDSNEPYGRIIHISAEHGRYVARSYSPRQLATASDGAPLFEIFLTRNNKGEYKQQAVYLKRRGAQQNLSIPSFMSSGVTSNVDSQDATENKNGLLDKNTKNTEDGDESDDDSGFENVLRDMIPGVKVKVVQVTTPIKVDRDLISKAIEQIIDEEEEEKDFDLENVDAEDEIKGETDDEQNDIDIDAGNGISDGEEQSQISVKVVVGEGLIQKFSSGAHHKDLVRVPARLRKKGRLSFTFTVEEDDDKHISSGDGQSPLNKNAKLQGQRSMDLVMLDLVKSISKGKIPMKVLKDVGELINLTISQSRNRQPLSGSTTFNRIDISAAPDPLNGLYIGAHGLYTSEVIHLRRRFGQWKDDGSSKKPSKVEFYEYVEAVKLTGDPYVPAGQIAFRAKVGKRYQLPHKGIIPEEFGVVARYRGQGRLAEPGFQNPRWVDGELVILDGKYIKGGPVVGFVYWAPEYHFLVFFNRLRLQN